jgi:hypothetical protein
VHAGGLIVDPDPFMSSRRGQLVALASGNCVSDRNFACSSDKRTASAASIATRPSLSSAALAFIFAMCSSDVARLAGNVSLQRHRPPMCCWIGRGRRAGIHRELDQAALPISSKNLPEGLDTTVGARGLQPSGGCPNGRRRLCLRLPDLRNRTHRR